jgi:tetratricopeptide (TPR) repeat protein
MFRTFRVLAVSAAFLPALPLAAQQPAAAAPQGPVCDVEQMQPGQLAMASINRSKVVNAKTPDEGMKAVRDGLKNIFDKATAQNALGRDYLAAQFMLLAVEFGGEVQTRANLNLPGDKAQTVDLLVAADSLLKLVETAKPGCKDEITQWREYKPFANRIQAAYAALQANQLDSAEKSAMRAMLMAPYTPQPYDVLWRLYQAKGDEDNQIKYLRLSVDKLTADTANARIRANLLFNLGRVQQGFAEKAQGDRKTAMWKGAAEAYLQVVAEHPASEEAPFAVSGISTRWALTQDSTEALQVLTTVKPLMGQLSDMALAQAGVMAVRLQRGADAADLFKAATVVNPYQRDYLYNYAATLFDLKRSAEMVPVVARLLELDPSNPDNVLLYAYAFKGMADATTDAAQKKALTDSAVSYSARSDGMKHKVTFTGFDRGKDNTQLQGEVENRDKADKSFTIEFEFLGKTGAVIEKKSVTVGPVKPNAMGTFNVEIAKGGVAGVKYAALP